MVSASLSKQIQRQSRQSRECATYVVLKVSKPGFRLTRDRDVRARELSYKNSCKPLLLYERSRRKRHHKRCFPVNNTVQESAHDRKGAQSAQPGYTQISSGGPLKRLLFGNQRCGVLQWQQKHGGDKSLQVRYFGARGPVRVLFKTP